eukprot:3018575-Alexandrium_andersonii.AAC.1
MHSPCRNRNPPRRADDRTETGVAHWRCHTQQRCTGSLPTRAPRECPSGVTWEDGERGQSPCTPSMEERG